MKWEDAVLGGLAVVAGVAVLRGGQQGYGYNEATVQHYMAAMGPAGVGGIALDSLQLGLDPNMAEAVRRLQARGWTYTGGILQAH